jgi:alpha-ketoglutarate-dependent taurine dioxygenase
MSDVLPEVSVIALTGQRTHYGATFPLALEWRGGEAGLERARGWLREQRSALEAKLELHGAIVFRGFPLAGAEDFDAFVGEFGLANFPYEESLSNAVRLSRTGRVVTANEAPPDVTIRLHHEMAQTPVFPSRLFFFCERPAEEGGATAVCRSDAVFEELQRRRPGFARACEERGLLYSLVMPAEQDPVSGMGRSWKSTFRAGDRTQAEERMRRLGYTWEWLPDGSLRATTPVLPAVHEIAPGRKSFFNQLIAAAIGWKDHRNDPARAIRHGDGSALDAEGVATASEIAESLTVDVPWRRGDVALVDNLAVMHGRRPFAGDRRILVSLAARA